jgi:cytochrome c biogenesis factor
MVMIWILLCRRGSLYIITMQIKVQSDKLLIFFSPCSYLYIIVVRVVCCYVVFIVVVVGTVSLVDVTVSHD